MQFPVPRCLDDGLKVRKLWSPPQFRASTGVAGNQHGRISGTPRCLNNVYIAPSDTLSSLNDLLHRKTFPVSEIVGCLCLAFERLQGKNVGVCQIVYMDVIPDAGTIGCRVIVSINAY